MEKGIELSDDTVLNAVFFEDIFPWIKGYANLIHSSLNSPCHNTVRNDQIKFYDEDADDPDTLVKIACTIMIATVSEVEQGLEKL